MSLNNLTDLQIQRIIDIFRDLSSYKVKERENYDDMLKRKKIYVEVIPHETCVKVLCQVKEKRRIRYLIGKRGTGKTTILNRLRIECYESFFIKKELDYLKSEKMVLPVYIELKNFFLNIIDKIDISENKITELNNISKQLSIEFLRQIENTYEELRELGIIDIKIFKKVEEIISNAIEEIEKKKSVLTDNLEDNVKDLLIELNLSIQKVNYYEKNKVILHKLEKDDHFSKYWTLLIDIELIKDVIHTLKKLKDYPLNNIHFLFDNFSEISLLNQKLIVDNLIKPLFRDLDFICFCIACYPHFYYSDSMKLDDDYTIINLDWYELFSKYPLQDKIKNGINLLTQILFKRLHEDLPEIFPDEKSLNLLFKNIIYCLYE